MSVTTRHHPIPSPANLLHTLDAARVPAMIVDAEQRPVAWNRSLSTLLHDAGSEVDDRLEQLAGQLGERSVTERIVEKEVLLDIGQRLLHAGLRAEPVEGGVTLVTLPFRNILQSPAQVFPRAPRGAGADPSALFASAPFGAFVLEPLTEAEGLAVDFLITGCNPAALEQLGVTAESVLRRPLRAAMPTLEPLGMLALLQRAHREQRGFHHELDVPAGDVGQGSWVLDVMPTPTGLLVLLRDRSHRRLQAERHAAALSAMADAILLATEHGTVVSTNQAAERLFGADEGGLEGLHLAEMLFRNGRPFRVLEETPGSADARRPPRPRELDALSLLGVPVPVRLSVVPYAAAGERGFVVSLHDLRPLKSLEGQLHTAQKIEALGTLAAELAHDLRNLLQVISGNAEDIQDDENADGFGEQLDDILRASGQATELCQSLLTFSRTGEATQTGTLDASLFLRRSASVLARALGKNHELVTDVADLQAHLPVSEQSLSQVLLNLVVNARDAMPEGGTVTLRYTADGDDHALLSVADTGEGMTPEVVDRVFDPFFTTKPAGVGTGLGLATVMSVMHRCGGTVEVESTKGLGTTFLLRFPLTAPT